MSPGQQESLSRVITKNLTAQEGNLSILSCSTKTGLLSLTVHVGNHVKEYWEHAAQSIEDTIKRPVCNDKQDLFFRSVKIGDY